MSTRIRPAVDAVVPFLGSPEALQAVISSLARLRLADGDTLTVVDNGGVAGPAGERRRDGAVTVVSAPGIRTPAYARNRGAELGHAEWLVFFDADTAPTEHLIDRYFEPPPRARTGLLGGGIVDEPVVAGASAVARYAHLRGAMSQDDTFRFGRWGYPKSANIAVRRSVYAALGGFREDIRAGEDADFVYRLRAAGWEVERREAARVIHTSRPTLASFVHQKLVHGSGGAWLERAHPGSFPARRRPGLVWWAARHAARELAGAARTRDRDRALWATLEPLEFLAFEFGRSLPNERPLTTAVWLRALRRLIPPVGTPRI